MVDRPVDVAGWRRRKHGGDHCGRVTCRPYVGASYRCEVGGYDLSEMVLYNGGGRSLAGAPPEPKAAETPARSRVLPA